ncbi:MAG: DUF1772 domain-containing protein [Burkholderiales bacterium RIFCSPLOWO2_02_FULL_57_36]|nr:MAG: DUF1772 domain-containing protein [Burkholderiales bacterium RIFCSPLOWO2_02_FULL_57_36]
MLLGLKLLCILLVSISMALALAHALELPGKLRLEKKDYLTVQEIYYPGFTVGGFAEVLGLLALAGLLYFIPIDNPSFKWTLASFIALAALHATYWILTHPTNKFWLQNKNLKGTGAVFFESGSASTEKGQGMDENLWKRYRNRWEASHVIRAVLGVGSLMFLAYAIAL